MNLDFEEFYAAMQEALGELKAENMLLKVQVKTLQKQLESDNGEPTDIE